MPTEEYEAYMTKQEAAFKTEVTTVVQEPKVGDVPPVVVTTMQQMTTTIISGQVCTSEHRSITDGDSDSLYWVFITMAKCSHWGTGAIVTALVTTTN